MILDELAPLAFPPSCRFQLHPCSLLLLRKWLLLFVRVPQRCCQAPLSLDWLRYFWSPRFALWWIHVCHACCSFGTDPCILSHHLPLLQLFCSRICFPHAAQFLLCLVFATQAIPSSSYLQASFKSFWYRNGRSAVWWHGRGGGH